MRAVCGPSVAVRAAALARFAGCWPRRDAPCKRPSQIARSRVSLSRLPAPASDDRPGAPLIGRAPSQRVLAQMKRVSAWTSLSCQCDSCACWLSLPHDVFERLCQAGSPSALGFGMIVAARPVLPSVAAWLSLRPFVPSPACSVILAAESRLSEKRGNHELPERCGVLAQTRRPRVQRRRRSET